MPRKPKSKKEPKPRRKRQPDLPAMVGPGVEQPSVPEIDAAADKYVSVRDARMELTKKEVESNAALLAAMKEHKLETYEYDGNIVTVKATAEKARVKRKQEYEEGDWDDKEEE